MNIKIVGVKRNGVCLHWLALSLACFSVFPSIVRLLQEVVVCRNATLDVAGVGRAPKRGDDGSSLWTANDVQAVKHKLVTARVSRVAVGDVYAIAFVHAELDVVALDASLHLALCGVV